MLIFSQFQISSYNIFFIYLIKNKLLFMHIVLYTLYSRYTPNCDKKKLISSYNIKTYKYIRDSFDKNNNSNNKKLIFRCAFFFLKGNN